MLFSLSHAYIRVVGTIEYYQTYCYIDYIKMYHISHIFKQQYTGTLQITIRVYEIHAVYEHCLISNIYLLWVLLPKLICVYGFTYVHGTHTHHC